MADPLLMPAVAMLTGGALAYRDYRRRRMEGTEDRYMALYGAEEWSASNMDLALHAAPDDAAALKAQFLDRLAARLAAAESDTALLREVVDEDAPQLAFRVLEQVTVDDLQQPRKGVWLDLSEPDRVRVVWNHMQTDGVGLWSVMRGLFDPNPPLIAYDGIPAPPPVLPEILALPRTLRRAMWRGRLRAEAPDGTPLHRGLSVWDAAPIRATRERLGAPFNLLTAALAVEQVLQRHPDKDRLNVGLTAYFPFLEGRNRYGVFLCRVRRAGLDGLVEQLVRQTKSPLLNWGTSAAQSYALARMPDLVFARLISYYRRQIDVLVSSLPVGQLPITLGGVPIVISAHPWELTLPYYFLLVGTYDALHVSYTSRFAQDASFTAMGSLPLD